MMAVMQLLRGVRDVKSWMLFLFFLVTALQMYQVFVINHYFHRPVFITQQIFGVPKFIIGPVLYIYFCLLFDRKYRFRRITCLHFIPPVISVVHRIIFLRFYLPVDFGISVSHEIFQGIALFLDFSGFLILLVYLYFTFRKIRLLSVIGRVDTTLFRLSAMIILYAAVIIILYLYSVFNPDEFIIEIFNVLSSAAILVLFYLSQKYPELLDWFRREVKEESYKNSLLKGMDLQTIRERLTDLMEEEKIYYDDELTPQTLADLLSISPHQLSELLNQHMEMNFYGLVNHYRIEEVKQLLVKHREQSILSLAYSVGFNSKSSFYDAFSKLTGMTPLQYRRKYS